MDEFSKPGQFYKESRTPQVDTLPYYVNFNAELLRQHDFTVACLQHGSQLS